MFEGIGKIGQYVQLQNLKYEAKYKMRTGRRLQDDLKAAGAPSLDALSTKKTKKSTMTDSTKLAIIKSKLRKGQELSTTELRYLKENDSDLYQKAKQTQSVRAELQQALKHAKTRQEALQAVAAAQAKVAASAVQDAKNGGGAINMSGAFSTGAADAASFSVDPSADIGAEPAAALSVDGAGEDGSVAATGETASAAIRQETAGSSVMGTGEEPSAAQAEPAAGRSGEAGLAADGSRTSAAQESGAAGSLTDQQAASSKKSDAQFDDVHVFELQAILDEWKKFAHSKDYAELPQDVVSGEKQSAPGRQPYRGKAADAYAQSGLLLEDAASLLSDAAEDSSSDDQ